MHQAATLLILQATLALPRAASRVPALIGEGHPDPLQLLYWVTKPASCTSACLEHRAGLPQRHLLNKKRAEEQQDGGQVLGSSLQPWVKIFLGYWDNQNHP